MQRKLLANGNVFKRTDGRWGGVVWYMDEQTSYDKLEGTARCQIYPLLGDKVVGDITFADVKPMLNHWMYLGRSYSLVKKAYVLLNEYYRKLYVEERIHKNPMDNVEMMKKANILSAQGKEG